MENEHKYLESPVNYILSGNCAKGVTRMYEDNRLKLYKKMVCEEK